MGKTIPRGIGLVVGAVAVIYAFLPAVALSAMPVEGRETLLALPKEEGGYADDPVLGVVANMDLGALQGAAEVYVGLLASTILFIATNAGLLGVSRLSYSMGQHRQLPELLRALHPRFRTPYVAITLFGLIACVAILPGQADFLGVIYAFGAMMSFTIAHVVGDRAEDQASRRRAAVALARARCAWRGYELPLLAIFGGLGTGIALIVATVLDLRVFVVRLRVARGRDRHLRGLPAPPGPVAHRDAQDRDPEARGRARGGVRVDPRGLRGRPLLAGGGGHRREAGRAQSPGHPRGGDHHGAVELADRRGDARGGGARGLRDRLRPGEGRAPRDRALGEGPAGSGGPAGSSRRRARSEPAPWSWSCRRGGPARRCSGRRSRPC